MTASVAPRMRVDNRVTVYTYYGTQVANKPFTELRSACWRPRPLVRATHRTLIKFCPSFCFFPGAGSCALSGSHD